MTAPAATGSDERVLVLAPTGRDALVTCDALTRAALRAEACATADELCRKVAEGAGALVVAEEALDAPAVAALSRALAQQAPWSDVPLLITTGEGGTSDARVRAIGALEPSGNVTVLERPMRVFTLVATVQAMLRARRRQYQTRDLLLQIQAHIDRLDRERELRARFVSMLAHDLRGPVSAAMLASEMIIRTPERLDERRDIGVRIKRNLDRVERMVRNLLDATRIEAGHPLPLRLDECELTAIAWDVAEELNNVHGERVRLDVKEEVHGVWSAEELRRAIWNLATNAIKYGAPDAPVTTAIRRRGERVQLSVHNEGTPISSEDQRNLFQPFSRARTAESGTQLGWGLGLTLVRGCVEAHGGEIRVESSIERGTTFSIDLPLDARPFQARHQAASKA